MQTLGVPPAPALDAAARHTSTRSSRHIIGRGS